MRFFQHMLKNPTTDFFSAQSEMHATLRRKKTGFTLLETLVAITLLTIAIVAPMSLTTQALGSAYYARDQITASYLAQEGLEAVRSVRDANIISNSLGGRSTATRWPSFARTSLPG